VLLLGPGRAHLKYRRKLKKELVRRYHYNDEDVVVMEDVKDVREDAGIEPVLKEYNPMLVIAFFHKEARMDSVMFEIGFLCGFHGTKILGINLGLSTTEILISKLRVHTFTLSSRRLIMPHSMIQLNT
jgi:hypothetical protein